MSGVPFSVHRGLQSHPEFVRRAQKVGRRKKLMRSRVDCQRSGEGEGNP